jgi:hypothetical protein
MKSQPLLGFGVAARSNDPRGPLRLISANNELRDSSVFTATDLSHTGAGCTGARLGLLVG